MQEKRRQIRLPEGARKIIEILNQNGYEAYVVGGCVRDSLLGREPADWDITTSALPQQVKALFKTIDTGLRHGTVTVLLRDKEGIESYEVTTYRIDGEYEDARHPKEVTFTSSLSEDLARRDFTVNAMAYHPEEGVVDLYGGEEDLEKRIIRCVGDAKERFTEDALRMMRAIRFAAQLSACIEDNTYAAIREMAPSIEKVSAERIHAEMEKLLDSDNPMFFKLFYETGLSAYFMPEFDRCMETEQNNPHHLYSVGEHILYSLQTLDLERLRLERPDTYDEDLRLLRITMLLHDIAKPQCKTTDENGIDHFKGHNREGVGLSEEILRRLKYDNDTIEMVKGFTLHHDWRPDPTPSAIRRGINRIGEKFFPLLFYVMEADLRAQSDYEREQKETRLVRMREIYEEIVKDRECVSLKTLAVKGADLIAAGYEPGPQIGKILSGMLEEVLENPEHNERDYLMKLFDIY